MFVWFGLGLDNNIFSIRLAVVKEAEKQFKCGKFPEEFFSPDTPSDWFRRMKRNDEFVDAVFFQLAAFKLGRDIILLHVHPESVQNGAFNWIKGGPLLSDISAGAKCPMFLGKIMFNQNSSILYNCCHTSIGYYEESHYAKGHFQSVVPIRNSPVLDTILSHEGFDVCSHPIRGSLLISRS